MEMQNTPQSSNSYRPVSCDFIDELEVYSLKKEIVNLKVQGPEGQVAWIHGRVKDIFTRDHAEFVQLEDGSEIRLDHILEHHLYQ